MREWPMLLVYWLQGGAAMQRSVWNIHLVRHLIYVPYHICNLGRLLGLLSFQDYVQANTDTDLDFLVIAGLALGAKSCMPM